MTRDELYERLNDIILGCGGDVDDAMEHVDSYAATQRAEIEQQIEAHVQRRVTIAEQQIIEAIKGGSTDG